MQLWLKNENVAVLVHTKMYIEQHEVSSYLIYTYKIYLGESRSKAHLPKKNPKTDKCSEVETSPDFYKNKIKEI